MKLIKFDLHLARQRVHHFGVRLFDGPNSMYYETARETLNMDVVVARKAPRETSCLIESFVKVVSTARSSWSLSMRDTAYVRLAVTDPRGSLKWRYSA